MKRTLHIAMYVIIAFVKYDSSRKSLLTPSAPASTVQTTQAYTCVVSRTIFRNSIGILKLRLSIRACTNDVPVATRIQSLPAGLYRWLYKFIRRPPTPLSSKAPRPSRVG
jgi:hypothetical protein